MSLKKTHRLALALAAALLLALAAALLLALCLLLPFWHGPAA